MDKLKYINRMLRDFPEMENWYNREFIAQLTANATAARARRKQSICSKSNQPVPALKGADVSRLVLSAHPAGLTHAIIVLGDLDPGAGEQEQRHRL